MYWCRHRPKSALERGGTRSRPGTGVTAIEETDENAPEPELMRIPSKDEAKEEVTFSDLLEILCQSNVPFLEICAFCVFDLNNLLNEVACECIEYGM